MENDEAKKGPLLMTEREQRLASLQGAGMVPSGYAEKSMASLMQLHSELMEEKERRVDLYRRLSEKEQTIAELRGQIKRLEEKLGSLSGEEPQKPSPPASQSALRVSPQPSASEWTAPRREGWRQW